MREVMARWLSSATEGKFSLASEEMPWQLRSVFELRSKGARAEEALRAASVFDAPATMSSTKSASNGVKTWEDLRKVWRCLRDKCR